MELINYQPVGLHCSLYTLTLSDAQYFPVRRIEMGGVREHVLDDEGEPRDLIRLLTLVVFSDKGSYSASPTSPTWVRDSALYLKINGLAFTPFTSENPIIHVNARTAAVVFNEGGDTLPIIWAETWMPMMPIGHPETVPVATQTDNPPMTREQLQSVYAAAYNAAVVPEPDLVIEFGAAEFFKMFVSDEEANLIMHYIEESKPNVRVDALLNNLEDDEFV